jgi:hypothetical protein
MEDDDQNKLAQFTADELENIRRMARVMTSFSPEEIAGLKQLAKMLAGLEAIGSVGQFFKKVLLWCIGVAVALVAIQNGLVEYLKGALGK